MTKKIEDAAGPADAPAATVAPAPVETSGDLSSALDGPTLSPAEEALDLLLLEWMGVHFCNTPVSQATQALNYLRDVAVPDLRAQLLKEKT
jgi:hypothetical protein